MDSSFTLSIPELRVSVSGDSSASVDRTDFSSFKIEIRNSQVEYGSIRSKINTESAGIIMDTKRVNDSIVCNFDLTKLAGFRLKPGRNSVEVEARDSRRHHLYSSFLLDTAVPAKDKTYRPIRAKPDEITGKAKYGVVVGVSHYQDPAIPQLQFADQDAQAIRDFLLSPQGGRFESGKIKYLVNEDATMKNLRAALYTFLADAQKDDLVLIYFAGHGSADPNDPRNLYLLPYDTEIYNMGGSAFPMWEMQDVFARVIKADRIVTLTDACHSAGISGESAGADSSPRKVAGVSRDLSFRPMHNNLINQYLAHYASEGQRAVLTASDISETSIEGKRWGGGHGVFTYFLLEGIKGKADEDADGTVTAGELFDYVRQQVILATEGKQNPTVLPGLARALPLSGKAVQAAFNRLRVPSADRGGQVDTIY